jgi:hypothetical protein
MDCSSHTALQNIDSLIVKFLHFLAVMIDPPQKQVRAIVRLSVQVNVSQ